MSSDDDEDGIFIELGEKKEEFTFQDANDPLKVQARFNLENKPTHVIRRNKEVQFGKLKNGVDYKLPKLKQDEEEGVIIEDHNKKEKFTVQEANDAAVVQVRFALDNKPFYVLNINNKEIHFGKLKDGVSYKLPKSKGLIPYLKAHTQNAIILSKAVKETSPTTFVDEHSRTHSIMSICGITKYSRQKVVLAIGQVADKNVLYAAYEGSSSESDLTEVLHTTFEPKIKENPSGEQINEKLEERAITVPAEYIIKCAEEKKCGTIVTCGYSSGGAVSALAALNLMDIDDRPNVYNITFGAPFFGNEAIKRKCKTEGFEHKFVHYVDCLDVVPGFLCLGPATQMISNETVEITDKRLVTNCKKFEDKSEGFIKFLLQKGPLSTASNTDDDNPLSFTSLCSDIMTGFDKIGSDDIFAPIGNYIQLKNGSTKVLDATKSSAQFQDRILKAPFTKVKSVSEIKDGCSINSYFSTLASTLQVDLTPRKVDYEEDYFEPKINGNASIVWTRCEDEQWRCQLAVRGHFLKSLQLGSPLTDFAGMPFKATSSCINVPDGKNEATFLSERTMEMPTQLGESISVKLATPFGKVELVSQVGKSNLEMDYRNISFEESVALILDHSVSRSLAISNIADGEENHADDGLKSLINQEVEKLEPEYQQTYKQLYDCPNPLSRTDDISKLKQKIIENITREMTIYKTYSGYIRERIRNTRKGFWKQSVFYGMFYFMLFGDQGKFIQSDYVEQLRMIIDEIKSSGILKANPEKDDLLGELLGGELLIEESIHKNPKSAFILERLLMSYEKDQDHLKTIENYCTPVWQSLILELVKDYVVEMQIEDLFKLLEKTDLSTEEFITYIESITKKSFQEEWLNGIEGKYTSEVTEMLHSRFESQIKYWKNRNNLSHISIMKNYIFEGTTNIIHKMSAKQYLKHIKDNFPRESDKILAHLTESSKIEVENKISSFRNVHEIRKLYGRQCYIGFIGPQNAGKSTLLNKLFGKSAKTGMRTHTEEPTKYHVSEDIYVIDFPGSDSIAEQRCASLESSGYMNNFQVLVMQYNGSPTKEIISNVKLAYRLKKTSGKSSETIFCLNKSAAHICEDNDSFTDQYRSEYVKLIKDHIASHPYDEKEENLWKRLKERAEEHIGDKVYEEIARMNEELKEYTLDQIKDDDFIFTDWLDKDTHKKGIMGPEEVKRRIQKFLVAHNISRLDNVMDF